MSDTELEREMHPVLVELANSAARNIDRYWQNKLRYGANANPNRKLLDKTDYEQAEAQLLTLFNRHLSVAVKEAVDLKQAQEIVDRLEYRFLQIDRTMDWPNSYEGDVFKMVYKLLKSLATLTDKGQS